MEITKKIKPIGEIFKIHRDLLEKLGFSGSEPYKDKFITDLITQISKASLNIDSDKIASKSAQELFNDFMLIFKLDDDINKADDIFKTYEQSKTISSSVSLSVSSSYTQDIEETSTSLSTNILHFDNYIRNLKIDGLFASVIVDKGVTNKMLDDIAAIYISFVKKNSGKYVVDLYTKILELSLQSIVGTKQSRDIVLYINKLLETVKDDILETPEHDEMMKTINLKNIKANSVQFLIEKYELTPATELLNIDKILKLIGISVAGKTLPAKLDAASRTLSNKKQKFGFVVIYKITNHAFRHTLDPLISEQYIHKAGIMDSALAGISEKTIARTNTIQPLEISKGIKDRIDIYDSQFSKTEENFYYVLQSLNGNEFEILTPWGFGTDRFDMSADLINFKDPVNSRVSKYNYILNDEICKNLSDPMVPPLGTIIEMKLEESYWNGVIGKIKNHIIPKLKEMLLKKSEMTSARFANFITSPEVLKIIFTQVRQFAMNDMLANMKKVPTDPIIIDQFNDEMNITFSQSLDNIVRKLPKRMMNIWKEELESKLIKRMGKSWKSTSNNVIQSMEFVNKLLTDTLRIYINRKSGIFISIRRKIDILENTLLKES